MLAVHLRYQTLGSLYTSYISILQSVQSVLLLHRGKGSYSFARDCRLDHRAFSLTFSYAVARSVTMFIPAPLSPSPVLSAFVAIQNCPLKKFRLTATEEATLAAAELNPVEYTLAKREEAAAYVRVLLKILAEASGPSGPSPKVSKVVECLSESEAVPLIYTDPIGIMTHYVISKLHEVIVCLKEMKEGSAVSIGSMFYNDRGILCEDWKPLLRILHFGGAGDPFAQSEYFVTPI